MVTTLAQSLGQVAPYYNLVLVIIVITLFYKLFSLKKKGLYVLPWKLLFYGILIFVAETVLTILEGIGIIDVHFVVAPLMEMVIISLFIYMLLLQKEFVKFGKK